MRKLVFLLFGLALACNEIRECDLDPDVEFAIVGFFNSADSTEREVAFKSFSTSLSDGVSTIDTGTYYQFYLDPTNEEITYYFETDSDTYDMTFTYEINSVNLYSLDCGATFKYDSLQASSNSFDSIAVVGPILNKNITLNVEIYF
ncbi:MAG: hypothetical protein ABJN36_14985 [Cyclobacteriaceae bacterium]